MRSMEERLGSVNAAFLRWPVPPVQTQTRQSRFLRTGYDCLFLWNDMQKGTVENDGYSLPPHLFPNQISTASV